MHPLQIITYTRTYFSAFPKNVIIQCGLLCDKIKWKVFITQKGICEMFVFDQYGYCGIFNVLNENYKANILFASMMYLFVL